MAHPMTLPTVAMIALVGTGLGVHLGKEAISEINPLYFTMPEGTKTYAALTPQGTRYDQAPPLRPASEAVGLGDGCVGCRSLADDFEASPQPNEALYAQRRWDMPVAEPEPALEQLPQVAQAPSEEQMLIRTYSSYPVTTEEQRRHELAIRAAVTRGLEPERVTVVETVEVVEPVGL